MAKTNNVARAAKDDKVIIGIHGLANKPPLLDHAEDWKRAIAEGLHQNRGFADSFEFEMAYWADLLYKSPMHSDQNFYFDDLYDDEPYYVAPPNELKRYKDGLVSTLTGLGGGLLDRLTGAMGYGKLGQMLLERFARDLAFYYDAGRFINSRKGRRLQAGEALREELKTVLGKHKGKKILLIAHSMGSIIAYDTLRIMDQATGGKSKAITIESLVTIGSPLGHGVVKQQMKQSGLYTGPFRTPGNVSGSWKNYADRRDPITFDARLANEYAANDHGVNPVDDLIRNDYRKQNSQGEPRPHKIYGYLRAPEVSEHIANFLSS